MKKFLILTLLFGVCSIASAQYRGGGGGDKFYFGGGFGLSIGTDYTSISASPLVGYKITDEFSAGLQTTYQYVSYPDFDLKFSNYGGGPFTRYVIEDRYIVHAEYEILSFEYTNGIPDPGTGDLQTFRDTYSALWLGGGYRESLGRNAGFFLLALYNVLYDETEPSPYASPLSIRAGVAVGF